MAATKKCVKLITKCCHAKLYKGEMCSCGNFSSGELKTNEIISYNTFTSSASHSDTDSGSGGPSIPNGRSSNGKIEKCRLEWLVDTFNSYLITPNEDFIGKFKSIGIDYIDIDKFEVAGGRGKKYDIVIKLKDGSTKNIEHKAYTNIVDHDDEHPWKNYVQLLNLSLIHI